MRKFILFVICPILCLTTINTGCEKFLEEKAFTELAPGSFPVEAHAETFINAVYNRAGRAFLTNNRHGWAVYFVTPSMMYQYRNNHPRGSMDRWTWQNNWGDPCYYDLMDRTFDCIRSCNDAIDQVPLIAMVDTERQKEIVGEAKYIRGLCYFHMVRLWGPIMIVDKGQTLADDLLLPRSSVPEVYAFIEQNLLDAIEVLPSRSDYASRGTLGHATKEAAQGLLAQAYLTMAGEAVGDASNLGAAKTLLDEIVQSGEHFLMPTFAEAWDWKNDNNEEFLFAYQSEGADQSFATFHHFPPNNSLLPIWYPPGVQGINYDLVEPEYADSFRIHDNNGPRYQWSIITEWYDIDSGFHVYNAGPREAAYVGKFRFGDFTAGTNSYEQPLNTPDMRYSEVLLMRAELINELNGAPDAIAYGDINAVRERAELDPLSGLDYETFREAVYKERRYELFIEKEWLYDMRRRGFQYTKDLMYDWYEIPAPNGYPGEHGPVIVTEHRMLFPIPQNYLEQNPNITQNPGY